jgi:uncharacterized protein (TIGR00369 family)
LNDSSRYRPHEPPDSGAHALVGYDIDLSDPDGIARVTLEIGPQHLNRVGTLHGGIHAMMLDAAAGFAASRMLAGDGDLVPVVTLTLTTDFVSAANTGVVQAVGRVAGGGYKIVYADAELRGSDGRLFSRASGVFKRAAA